MELNETRTIEIEGEMEGYVMVIAVVLSIASVMFGCVSWAVLPKWRQFRHYAFISVLLADVIILVDFVEFIRSTPAIRNFRDFVVLARFFAFTQWLVIITAIFYVEFVQVFASLESISWLYLKANIFGWLLPIVSAIIEVYCDVSFIYLIYASLTFTNLVLCVIVLFRLCKTLNSDGLFTKIVVSICAFTFTGVVLFFPVTLLSVKDNPEEYVFSILAAYSYIVIIFLLNVFFLMLKSHRTLWREYWLRKRNNHL